MYEIDDIDESSDEEGNKPSKRESTKTVRGFPDMFLYMIQYMHTMACQRSTPFWHATVYVRLKISYLEIKPLVIL